MIKNEAPARFHATLSCGRIKITSGVREFDNEAVDSALSEHDSGDDRVAAGSFRSRAGFGACISWPARLMVGEKPRP
jgi:hypothetical protein